MLEIEPPLPFIINPHISVFGLDQCNHWQVAKNSRRGHFRGAERLDARGMPLTIRSETVCNAVQRHVPFTMGMLTDAEVRLIAEEGPYTESHSNLYAALEPHTVKQQLWKGVDELIEHISPLHQQTDSPSQRQLAQAIMARPTYLGGKTQMDILPTIPNCDTKAFKDVFKFVPILLARAALTCLVMIIFCDGQTVEILRASKCRWPHEYKRVVAAQGYFHAFTHMTFCINEGFWKVCLCTFARWLHKEKQIYEQMKDLEHDNAKHALDFHRVVTAAILCYMELHVTDPPPALFRTDPRAYIARVNHQGGVVLMMYLLHGGVPILSYQRAIRKGNGKRCAEMMAYSVHLQRSLAFKVKSVLINLFCLLGATCTHPKVQQVIELCGFISLFGDNLFAYDRFIEYVNRLQINRSTAYRGYDSQLHFTAYLKPLVHIDAAWQEVDGAGHNLDDGIPTYLYNDVDQLVRKLVATLGTDLTVLSAGNSLWHTGNPVPINGGDYRERRPWLWIWEVAFGRATGKGRGQNERRHWREHVKRWLFVSAPDMSCKKAGFAS